MPKSEALDHSMAAQNTQHRGPKLFLFYSKVVLSESIEGNWVDLGYLLMHCLYNNPMSYGLNPWHFPSKCWVIDA